MSDLIDRQAAIDGKICIQRANGVEIYDDYAVPVKYLEQLPSAQPERIKGRWIPMERKNLFRCSECGAVIYSETEYDRNEFHAFCGRCGAEMEVTT